MACSEAIQSEIEHYLEMLINGVDFTDEKAIDLLNAVQSGVKQSSNFEKVYRKLVTSAVSVIMYSPYVTRFWKISLNVTLKYIYYTNYCDHSKKITELFKVFPIIFW